MELKFTATVTLTEEEIRNLIDAEVRRRFANVKVLSVSYNIDQYQPFGPHASNLISPGVVAVPSYNLRGAVVTVEQTRSE